MATPPFLLVGSRRDSGVVVPSLPRISRSRAPGITADAYLCPRLPVPAEPLLAATPAVVAAKETTGVTAKNRQVGNLPLTTTPESDQVNFLKNGLTCE